MSALACALTQELAQDAFIGDRHALVGVNHLLPFEEFDVVERFFEKRLG